MSSRICSAGRAARSRRHLEAVEERQPDVEHDQLHLRGQAGREAGGAVAHDRDPVPLALQAPGQGSADRLVVLDEEHLQACHGQDSRRRREHRSNLHAALTHP